MAFQPGPSYHEGGASSSGAAALQPPSAPSNGETTMDQLEPFIHAERQFVAFQQQGEHDKAVRVLEGVLKHNKDFVQGVQDTLLSSLFEKLAVGYNTLGMKYLKLGKTDLSLRYFQKSEVVTDPANLHIHHNTRLVLRAVTYNNMGCFYKSMNKLHTALSYLRKALVIEERALEAKLEMALDEEGGAFDASDAPGAQNPAATHLNLCALLSQMSMHDKALYHAQKALQLLQGAGAVAGAEGKGENGAGAAAPPAGKEQQSESLTPVAYFNMGAEYEHLKYYHEALEAYENAYQSCLSELGSGHALTSKIAASVKQLKKKLGPSGGKKGGHKIKAYHIAFFATIHSSTPFFKRGKGGG
ncbi:unnamed protein product [Amoebophrya sp. A25]|nr:unnamed protein product [Amoebophrya sp. A25]|eukprot:GSA25T00014776001.1